MCGVRLGRGHSAIRASTLKLAHAEAAHNLTCFASYLAPAGDCNVIFWSNAIKCDLEIRPRKQTRILRRLIAGLHSAIAR